MLICASLRMKTERDTREFHKSWFNGYRILIVDPRDLERIARSDISFARLKLAENQQKHSVRMGDVNFRDKINNNRGVIMGHANSTSIEGVKITGTSITVRITYPFNSDVQADRT